ncbi:cell growth-regulating nucleolar protein isoform X1 [Engystomops pustulosus]|uniref:cell growth-regulating nucleolar protein isoform X1 n=1 Tax=Engystomops pustulosus TaxID=76066 RepID=UPI003AFB78BE
MVFFTCDACGESLKKAQVEKHLSICRNCRCLSCIDCGKNFWGEEYKTHLRCISENEKYGGKAFEAKAKKGDVKQQEWIQRIQEAAKKPNISKNIKKILDQISNFDNVPKKQVKFQNWMKNCLKISDPKLMEEVWQVVAQATTQQKDETNNNEPAPESKSEPSETTEKPEEEKKKSKRERKEERQKKNKKEKKDLNAAEEAPQNGTKKKGKKRRMEEDEENNDGGNEEADGEEVTSQKTKKQRKQKGGPATENGEAPRNKKKRNDSEEEVQEEESGENGVEENDDEDGAKKGKFCWKGTIKALLRQAPDHELPIKKLRKKVIAQYYVISSEHHKSEEEILATFNAKIKNNPKFRVLKDRVKLVK